MRRVDGTATVDADTGGIVAALFGLVDTLKAHFDDVAAVAEFGLTPTQALALRYPDERLELTAAGRSRRDGEHQRVDRCGTRSAQRPGRHRQRPTRVGEVVDE